MVELLYGSEKRAWITRVTEAYNQAGHMVGGKRVVIKPIAAGSGEAMEDLLSGRSKAQLFSPASGLFIEMGNARAQRKDGRPLVGPTHTLVLSPVVIAMWKPMAEALGWPGKRIGWSDVLKLANDPNGWATLLHPEFGLFKFGHTHPEYSSSGLISVLAEVYAGADLPRNAVLQKKHLEDPRVGTFLRGIEGSVVFYGKSTGFFADAMFEEGYSSLSAAILYESSVIESYDLQKHPRMEEFITRGFPIVAIYPSDGTFWSDHPVGIVDRNVTSEQRQAAEGYIKFLLARDQQRLAMESGFRPGDDGIALAAPLDRAHGVDPDIDIPVRMVPPNDVIESVLDLWRENKRRARITIVLDRSQSMLANQKMQFAKQGAIEAVKLLGDDDRLSFLLFNHRIDPLIEEDDVKTVRARALATIPNIVAQGQTSLYDALKRTLDDLEKNRREDLITAIVLLSDGQDTNSREVKLQNILDRLEGKKERSKVRVFAIYYGQDANRAELETIAKASGGLAFEGKPENIVKVFKEEIFPFFAPR